MSDILRDIVVLAYCVRRGRVLATTIAASLLAGCGGDGGGIGGGAPIVAPVNQPPRFTTATTKDYPENGTTFVYLANAVDPENQAVTYSLSGGADAGLFLLGDGRSVEFASGLLFFRTPPNFDRPGDADGDNVYEVQLTASDGSASSTLTLRITVTNSREGIGVRRIATGFSQPLAVVAVPGSSDVFVAEKGGAIYRVTPATGAKTLFFTVPQLSTDGERGLLGLVAAPDYASSGAFYAYVTNVAGDIEIRSYRRNADRISLFAVLLTIAHRDYNNHNGGWLSFGPDGNLYIGTGDGGGTNDPLGNAQNTRSLLGKILRVGINPDPYAGAAPQFTTIPASNPFANGAGGAREVYAYGFRNPFRASFNGTSLLIGDVGQDQTEEVDLLRPQDAGGNYGWPFKEGTSVLRSGAPAGTIDPVLQYAHGTGPRQGNSVTGGYVYRGPVTSLVGSYVFGDFVSRNIWTVLASTLLPGQTLPSAMFERRNEDFAPDVGTIDQILSFGEDGAGNLFIVDLDGEIYEVVAAQ